MAGNSVKSARPSSMRNQPVWGLMEIPLNRMAGLGSTIALLFSMALPTPAMAQGINQPIAAHGSCDSKSGVTINGQRSSPFACDMVAVTRTQRGTVIIQFTDRRGDDGRVLGFAGMMEGKQGFGADQLQVMVVERLYLAGGADPVPVSRGTCMLNWTGLYRTGGRLIAVVCGARGQAEGADIQGRAVFTVKGTDEVPRQKR